MAVTSGQRIRRARDNYERILVAVTEVVAYPTQANIDTAIAAAGTDALVRFKLDYSVDGESYSWTAYQTFLVDQIDKLRLLEIKLDGPFEVRSIGRT